jgi:hypothetical protein
MSLELGAYYQRSIDRAHKRYLSSVKALALVRKLALPVLQVNIARRQVNVGQAQLQAGGAGPTGGSRPARPRGEAEAAPAAAAAGPAGRSGRDGATATAAVPGA